MKITRVILLDTDAHEYALAAFDLHFPDGWEGEWDDWAQAILLGTMDVQDLWNHVAAHLARIRPMAGWCLQGVDFTGAWLVDVDFTGADLRGANLNYAWLEGAHLEGADLRATRLKFAALQGANLAGADMRGSFIRYSDIRDACFYRTDLRGVELHGNSMPWAITDSERAYQAVSFPAVEAW